jgi:hypothetical protein
MSQHDSAPLPTVVQINIYREVNDHFEYLLLKRIDHDDKFWQVITEPVASHHTLADTLKQAEETQIGVRGFKHLSHEMYSYEWYARGDRGRDIVFAAELDPSTAIYPDHSRYSEYAWLPFEEAVARLKWNGNKEALRRLNDHLLTKRANRPLPPPSQIATTNTAAAAGPYGVNIPKRLPERPEDKLKPIGEQEEINASALFL